MSPEIVAVVWVLLQTWVYGLVPPEGVTVAEPVALPRQATLVCEVVAETAVPGWVIVVEAVAVRLL